MKFELGEIQETALVPLVIKARETQRAKPRIHDEKAVEIVEALDIDNANRYDKFLSHEGVVTRTIMFDDAVKTLLLQYPDAVCVNLGCGFDDRFSRVDNGQITWYDIDYPEILALRRRFFSPRNRAYLLPGDVTKPDWAKFVPKCKPVIAIAEDLFMYLDEQDVRSILDVIASSFPKGTLLAELTRAAKSKPRDTAEGATSGPTRWGTESAHEIEALDSRFKLVREESVSKHVKRYSLRGKAFNVVARSLNGHLAVFNWN